MSRKIDITRLKARSILTINYVINRVNKPPRGADYHFVRWMCSMSVVELHGIWEQYAEARLVALLNHDSRHFVSEQNLTGIEHISMGLASYIVRGGNRYFDFRSMGI